MKVLAKTTRGPVNLQLFRPSVIRGPWSASTELIPLNLVDMQNDAHSFRKLRAFHVSTFCYHFSLCVRNHVKVEIRSFEM